MRFDPFGLEMKGYFMGFVIQDINVNYVKLTGVTPYNDSTGMTVIGFHHLNVNIGFSLKFKCVNTDECSGDEETTYKAAHGNFTVEDLQLAIRDSWLPFIPNAAAKVANMWKARSKAVGKFGEKLQSNAGGLDTIATMACKNQSIAWFMLSLNR